MRRRDFIKLLGAIDRKTANSLVITLPQAALVAADDLIE